MRLFNRHAEFIGVKPRSWWNLITLSVVALMLGSLIGSSYLIYVHIYRTLSDANVVFSLNNVNLVEPIDLTNFNRVTEKFEQKKKLQTPPASLRNMFVFSSATSTKPHVSPPSPQR